MSALQSHTHTSSERLHFMQRLDRSATVLPGRCFLLLQNSPGMVSRASEEQHEIRLQFTQYYRVQFKRFNQRRAVWMECNVGQPTESCSILILPSYRIT